MHHKSTASSAAAAKYRTRLAAAFAAVAAPLFPAAIKKSPLIEMNRSINNPIAAPSPTNCRASHSKIAITAISTHVCFAVRLPAVSAFSCTSASLVSVFSSKAASSGGIPNSSRSINRLAVSGRAFPVSHLATACRVTPSCSASISWVMPFLSGRMQFSLPMSWRYPPFFGASIAQLYYYFQATLYHFSATFPQ